MKMHKSQGLTIPELMISTIILLPLFTMVVFSFIKCMDLNELTKNSSTALVACKNKLSQIENTTFAQVFGTYNNTTFTMSGINGIGVTYVDNSNADLLQITASFSWRQANGRIIGEDKDLDGVIDAGEDVNGNGKLDSIVQISTSRYDS